MVGRSALALVVAVAALGCRSEEPRGGQVASAGSGAAPGHAARSPVVAQLPDDPFVEARIDMVARTIAARGVTDPRTLTAMRLAPRHVLVPPAMRAEAYADRPLPIGYGLTISQPYIVAVMTEAAGVMPGDKVLEIGTGSGYQAVVLALMGAKVHTIEIHPELGERTQKVLESNGFGSINMRIGDGWYGWDGVGPFDAVIVTCATPAIPDRLIAQLKVGGRMVIPVGESAQTLEVIEKTDDGIERTKLFDVRFGLMTGVVEYER